MYQVSVINKIFKFHHEQHSSFHKNRRKKPQSNSLRFHSDQAEALSLRRFITAVISRLQTVTVCTYSV
jgi:hypothetical protein